jgi:hypothetical protein
MKETTMQQRMDLLTEIADAVLDTASRWLKRWRAGESDDGDEIRVRWQDDGTAVVEVDGDEVMRVQVEVTASVVDYVNAVNKPTGFVGKRTWARVPAGWFVRTPKGDTWFEVLATRREGDKQMVTLDVAGQRGTYPRDPDETVVIRRGTLADAAMDAAVDALGDAAILEDEPPFDPPYVRS